MTLLRNKVSTFVFESFKGAKRKKEYCNPPPAKGTKNAKVDNKQDKTPYSLGLKILIKTKELTKAITLVNNEAPNT